jgi:putative intracellular protease/amidase
MRILIVLTSQCRCGTDGPPTGFRFGEFAAVYLALLSAGAELVIASPLGGTPPVDRVEYDRASPPESVRAFLAEPRARTALQDTVELHRVDAGDFDAAFYPGGRGLLWDLPYHEHSIRLLAALYKANRPLAFSAEGPAALCRVRDEAGRPIVAGRSITLMGTSAGQPNRAPWPGEEAAEQELRAAGAIIVRADDSVPHVIADGLLITGQTPVSALPAANALLAAIAAGSSRNRA